MLRKGFFILTGIISCNILKPSLNEINNYLDRKISITLSYDYFIQSAASIEVVSSSPEPIRKIPVTTIPQKENFLKEILD